MTPYEKQLYLNHFDKLTREPKEIKPIAPFADSKYFTNHKFKEEEPGVFIKEEKVYSQNPMTGAPTGELTRVIKFKVYDVDPEYGTNIEFYIDNQLQVSGYYQDLADFQTTFKI